MKNPEQLLATEVANFLMMEYPNIIYRFDIAADIPLPPHLASRNRQLHGKFTRGYPDLLICKKVGDFGGLYLELKATKKVPNTEHTRRQAIYHQLLRDAGYKAMFVCGLENAKKEIKKFLGLSLL